MQPVKGALSFTPEPLAGEAGSDAAQVGLLSSLVLSSSLESDLPIQRPSFLAASATPHGASLP